MSKSQEYTSEKTSINKVTKVYKRFKFKENSIILDYGGGKYDTNKEYMKTLGCNLLVYDPYNRTEIENSYALNYVMSNGGADFIVCANVLNVIKEDDILLDILNNLLLYANSSTKFYIQVYEGDKSGIGKETVKGYQRNEKTLNYIQMIKMVFKNYNIKRYENIYEVWK